MRKKDDLCHMVCTAEEASHNWRPSGKSKVCTQENGKPFLSRDALRHIMNTQQEASHNWRPAWN